MARHRLPLSFHRRFQQFLVAGEDPMGDEQQLRCVRNQKITAAPALQAVLLRSHGLMLTALFIPGINTHYILF